MPNVTIQVFRSQNSIALNNSAVARSMNILPADWDVLRMAFSLSVDNLGTNQNITGNPDFSWGFCNGDTNIPPNTSCNNSWYLSTKKDATMSGGGPFNGNHYRTHYGASAPKFYWQHGSTITEHSSSRSSIASFWPSIGNVGADDWQGMFAMEVKKGTVNGSNEASDFADCMTLINSGSLTAHYDSCAFEDPFDAMYRQADVELDSNLSGGVRQFTQETGITAAKTISEETYGAMDTIFFSWDQTIATILIHNITVEAYLL